MTNCLHFRMTLYVAKEPCLDDRINFDGLNLLPCIHQNSPNDCEGHAIRERDKPTPWQPAGNTGYEKVIERSRLNFGDNPGQETKS